MKIEHMFANGSLMVKDGVMIRKGTYE